MSQQTVPSDFNPALKMYGGQWGAALPLVLLVGGLLWLSLAGPANPKSFWSIGFLAICGGLLLAKSKKEYCATVLRGISDRSAGVLIASWIFASVFGQIMQAGGIIEGLLWFGLNTGAQGSVFTVITFVAAMLFSLGTGTANGTILALTPVMYPAGVFLGADPVFLATAILSGGAFGDSYSPISSSNITSAFTQDADLRLITRTRAPLVLAAAAISLVIFAVFGGGGEVKPPMEFSAAMSPECLFLLLGFAVVIVCSLLGRPLIESLTYGIITAIAIGIAIGRLSFQQLLHPVTKSGMSTGLFEDGVNGVVGVIIFILFVLGIIRVVMESGIMETIVNWVQKAFVKNLRQAEVTIITSTVLTTIPISANVPCEVLLGKTFVSPISKRFGITPERAADLLCCSVCTIFYMLPWHIVCALWFNTVSNAATKYQLYAPPISAAFVMPYGWSLLFVLYFSAITGWQKRIPSESMATSS
ncbi:Na+/H+ antiporter NhaC family protein [Desulfolutivibrio sulfoxidireducens]|uniref:Na+/H+ antiporter NhaC family protein n=1 Tax=Desulfolutivibrio sulfoxidireducens TaxID=2773299 RepID=UPI00159DF664|nr:Na+/H+ antiporter NhaC family protein [Desulfolutivibrio sulfoxidireducens]QLA16624.1 sodium:proton antiporter [Desulfolutivibrio sulfoxidireducens]QLA19495.1 sodium:proton antiporter [Desulfolutivibrio sulfoxidireducens]